MSKGRVKDGKQGVAGCRRRTKVVVEGNIKNGGLYENRSKAKWRREVGCGA